ncbi:MAG: hypothetical protein IPI00_12530 [Flavobacteriales bacterium]|nr:hypothetical protein [Flavobacteriales bacterium]
MRLAGDGEVLGHRGIGSNLTCTREHDALSETEVNITDVLVHQYAQSQQSVRYHFLLFFVDELRLLDQQARDI